MINVREPLDPKISLWHFLAFALRFEREKHGLSLTQCGQIIGAARSTVSNIEAGRLKIHEDQAKVLDTRYGLPRLFELLLFYAITAHDPDWFRQFTGYEAQASVIRIYQGQGIPIPFQIEDYTRALLLASRAKDVDTALRARITRRDAILDRAEPPYVWLVLDEAALDYQIGGPEVMRRQLRHMIELVESEHISIRVISKTAGAHPGLDGPFRIITMESRGVAYMGAQRGGRLVEDTAEVREVAIDWERISMKALSEDDSRALIVRLLEAYE